MDFDRLCRCQRINVVGTSGSGKSTFARQLSEALNLPCYEMDRLFWKPDWQSSPDDEMFQKVRDVTSQLSWVLDGNYTRTIPIKWQNVQLVIWLDMTTNVAALLTFHATSIGRIKPCLVNVGSSQPNCSRSVDFLSC